MKSGDRTIESGPLSFLGGGGELGRLIRDKDWSRTPLGPAASWPNSLKTAVRIMLTSRQPIWIGWGPELVYLYNDAYKAIIGGKHPAMLGEPTSVVWSEIWDVIEPMLEQAMLGDEGTYVESQLLIMERNGYREETYYTFSYSPIPDDDGSPGGIICANTDDTRRVIGERQMALLRELAAQTSQARRWQDACAASARAMATNTTDLPFALIYLEEPDGGGFTLAGASGAAPGGVVAPHTIHGDGPWALDGLGSDAIRVAENPFAGDQGCPTGSWDTPPTHVALTPIAATGQTGRGGVLVAGLNPFRLFNDDYQNFLTLVAGQISAGIASAQAYEEEKQRAEAMAELALAKTRFFSNVSHEFRTPLTLMLGPVEDLLGGESGEARQQLQVVHRNSLRLLKLVNTMLDFSRIEAGRLQARFEPVDLARYTTELASNFRSACEKAGLELVIDCQLDEDAPPAYVDRDMWEKIVLNLLSNAFKFTLEGRIEVRLRASGGQAVLAVRDTGVGVSPEELPRIFDRFHRAAETRGRTHEGTGIGLALVHELVGLHGGSIEAHSELDKGSVFTVALPLGRAHLDPLRIVEAAERGPRLSARSYIEEAVRWLPGDMDSDPGDSTATEQSDAGAERPRVVWADDNADMREYVARLLGERFDVEPVHDGREALERVRELAAQGRTPDLVLSDAMMPRLDGFGLLSALRDDPELREIPVVLLSARAGEEARVEGAAAGADDYLIKPFSARELIARVDAHVRLGRVRTSMRQAVLESERRVRDNAEQLRAALELSAIGTWRWDIPGDRVDLSPSYRGMLGIPADRASLTLAEVFELIHPDDRQPVGEHVDDVRLRGAQLDIEFRIVRADSGEGTPEVRWLLARGSRVTDAEGQTIAVIGATIDITERKEAEEERVTLLAAEQRARQEAEALNEAARALGSELDAQQAIQTTTDLATRLVGAKFGAFFYNVLSENGETFMLYTLSGAPREAFDKFGMPRNTPIFEPTFRGERVVRMDDVLASDRYAKNPPHQGMPKGHLPVRSYMAVPVRSRSGEVLGGLFFGHPEVGVFTEQAERIATGLAAQAAMAVDNARLFEDAQRELEQRRLAESLLESEKRVLELIMRGAELPEVLGVLARSIEEASSDGLICSVLLADPTGRRLTMGAAPSLPVAYSEALDGLEIGPAVGSCGTAAHRREPVDVADIAGDPLWAGFKSLAAEHGLGACHSQPIISSNERLLGTVAMYYRQPRMPSQRDRLLIDRGTHLAGIVIERHRAESALRESENRFRVMANTAPAMLWVTDPEGMCTFLSRNWFDFTGQTGAEALGLGWLKAVHPDDRERSAEVFLEANATHKAFDLDYRVRRADGTYHWSIDAGRPRFDEDGEFLGFVGSVIDVHERKRYEIALRRSEERMAFVRRSTGVGYWYCDLPFDVLEWDEQVKAHFFLPADATVTIDEFYERIHPEDREPTRQAITRAINHREDYDIDYRTVHPDTGQIRWVQAIGRTDYAEDGTPLRFDGVTLDVTQRVNAEEALRRNAESFAAMVEQSPLGIYTVDSNFRVAHVSEGAAPAFRNVQPVIGRDFGEVMHTIWPESFANEAVSIFRHTLETGEPYVSPGLTEKRKDIGAIESYEWQVNRVRLADGQWGVVCYFFDTTRIQQANMALRESEERFRALADNMSQLAWTCDELGSMVWFNQRWLEYTGRTLEQTRGWGWSKLLKPEHADRVLRGLATARESGEVWEDTFALRGRDGQYRWFLTRAVPIRDESGGILHWFGTNTDITERYEHEDQMRTVMAELNHRVKNTLAVVNAIAGQTIRRSSDMETFSASFEARLRSIAKAHSLLTSTEWKGCTLDDIVRSELESLAGKSSRVTIEGPHIMLPPKRCLALHMVIHELTTNATKYGAFRDERGRVDVRWEFTEINGQRGVRLAWNEHCPASIAQLGGDGFGSRLIQQSVGYDLQGVVDREFTDSGLRCRIEFPLPDDRSSPQRKRKRADARPSSDSSKPLVLVVEDQATIAMLLVEQVEGMGLEVLGPASTLESALALVEDRVPDAAMLDVDLHGVKVYPLARQLRELEVPFVLLTGYGAGDLPEDLRDEPMFGKPVAGEQIETFLEDLRDAADHDGAN